MKTNWDDVFIRVGWMIGILVVGIVAAYGLYCIHDNSIKNIPYHTAIVAACSPPTNWNAPVCSSQNRP